MNIKHVDGCEYKGREDDFYTKNEANNFIKKLINERKRYMVDQDSFYSDDKNICPNVYCNIYTDLFNWFGFKNTRKINKKSLIACFTDVTNGGVGYYEKLIVLGGRILELYSELHFYNKYNYEKDEEIVSDLKNIKSVKDVVYHYLYVQKRKNRVTYKNSIYLFGYSYLYTPIFFNNKNAIIKYVKACIAYAVKFNETNIFSWISSLIEHIYYSQTLKVSKVPVENELIQDLQEFMGYRYDYLLPRIVECFNCHNIYINNSQLTGLQIIRLFSNDYFSLLAEDISIQGKEKNTWVREETDAFINSKCIEIFSGCMMSIGKYLGEYNAKICKIKNIFEMLLSSCWVLGKEERNKIWVSALIQRLRQVQLLTQITTIEKWSYNIKKYNDINVSNFIKDIYNFNNVNGKILSPFQLQNLNIYLPSKQTNLKQIPYYTTLSDKYTDKKDQKNILINKKKNKQFNNILSSITSNMHKYFKTRGPKNNNFKKLTGSLYPAKENHCADNKPNFSDNKLSSNESSSYLMDIESMSEELSSYSDSSQHSDPPISEKKKNGIPVKIKYIKNSLDDNKSKYLIEIPKKDLQGRGNDNHIKAVLWGNNKKGLEISLPVNKNVKPKMTII
ncbi:conserved protein, unknown function [Hepatocystis sp. ex Piliocolobus tephrosceles]|nr:conserved protein, unknown function [Hepatocystis sp. ex Piliocolobus tephrosceles]